jgi:hypothetical protein
VDKYYVASANPRSTDYVERYHNNYASGRWILSTQLIVRDERNNQYRRWLNHQRHDFSKYGRNNRYHDTDNGVSREYDAIF